MVRRPADRGQQGLASPAAAVDAGDGRGAIGPSLPRRAVQADRVPVGRAPVPGVRATGQRGGRRPVLLRAHARGMAPRRGPGARRRLRLRRLRDRWRRARSLRGRVHRRAGHRRRIPGRRLRPRRASFATWPRSDSRSTCSASRRRRIRTSRPRSRRPRPSSPPSGTAARRPQAECCARRRRRG